MRTVTWCIIAAVLTVAVQSALGEDTKVIKADAFEITIHAVETGKSFPAYVGDGKSLVNPLGWLGAGMSSIFMAKEDDGKTYSYMAGEIKAKDNAILVRVTIKAKNTLSKDQYLTIGDITLDYGTSTTFLAVGYGEYPFVKTGPVKEAVSREQNKIQPDDTRTLTYIFAVPGNSRGGRIVFKGKQFVSVHFGKE